MNFKASLMQYLKSNDMIYKAAKNNNLFVNK